MASLVLFTTLSLLSQVIVAAKVQACTKSEIDNLLLNGNVRICAANYTDLLPNKGCEGGLADQACYCHSPVSFFNMQRERGGASHLTIRHLFLSGLYGRCDSLPVQGRAGCARRAAEMRKGEITLAKGHNRL